MLIYVAIGSLVFLFFFVFFTLLLLQRKMYRKNPKYWARKA